MFLSRDRLAIGKFGHCLRAPGRGGGAHAGYPDFLAIRTGRRKCADDSMTDIYVNRAAAPSTEMGGGDSFCCALGLPGQDTLVAGIM